MSAYYRIHRCNSIATNLLQAEIPGINRYRIQDISLPFRNNPPPKPNYFWFFPFIKRTQVKPIKGRKFYNPPAMYATITKMPLSLYWIFIFRWCQNRNRFYPNLETKNFCNCPLISQIKSFHDIKKFDFCITGNYIKNSTLGPIPWSESNSFPGRLNAFSKSP